MRKLWAMLVLTGGLIGLIGVFLPFVIVRHADGTQFGAASAFDILAGNASFWKARGVVAVSYVPTVFLALFGAAALTTTAPPKRAGAFALVIAVVTLIAWALWAYGTYAAKFVDLGIGGNALLVAGLVGGAGAVTALRART